MTALINACAIVALLVFEDLIQAESPSQIR